MTPKQRERLRTRMLKDCRGMIADLDQMVRDTTYWNEIHPDETPLDVELERVTVHLLRDFEKELIANATNGKRLDNSKLLRAWKNFRNATEGQTCDE